MCSQTSRPRMGVPLPSIRGLSWLGLLLTSSLPPWTLTQAQPLPKRVAAVANFSHSVSMPLKASMAFVNGYGALPGSPAFEKALMDRFSINERQPSVPQHRGSLTDLARSSVAESGAGMSGLVEMDSCCEGEV